MSELLCGSYRLDLTRPLVMGIVNVTPDSFSQDGTGSDVAQAIAHARAQWEAGADILDLGAESTRPGAPAVSEAEELKRLLPVLEEVTRWPVPVSVDTYKPAVMRAALDLGAAMINDINALRSPGALDAVKASDCGLCLMHMQGIPGTMQHAPAYEDVLSEVRAFFAERVTACDNHGIARARLILDPGFGFGKTLEHNLALFRALTVTTVDQLPILAGVSRKSMLGAITGRAVEDRMPASIVAAVMAVQKGAKIVRVHDVAATRDALAVWAALEKGE